MSHASRYDEFSGKKLGAVFADDKQESTQFLLQHVLPVLKQYAVEEQEGSGRILWAGCQPSALRYQVLLLLNRRIHKPFEPSAAACLSKPVIF